MKILHVRHQTRYEYRTPVELGEHRLMTRPRDSHDLRLIEHLARRSSPPRASVRWIHDVFGNSIAIATFETRRAAADVHFGISRRALIPPQPRRLRWSPTPRAFLSAIRPMMPRISAVPRSGIIPIRSTRSTTGRERCCSRSRRRARSMRSTRMTATIKRTFTYAARDARGRAVTARDLAAAAAAVAATSRSS